MTHTIKNNAIEESSYQTKSTPLQLMKNFQYKQSRGAIIANIPTAKQEGSSNRDQVAYDDSNDAVHNTSNMNAEGNAKQENVESSREGENNPPNLKASNLPTTDAAFSDSGLAPSSKIPDGDAKQDRSPNPSEPSVESSKETGNELHCKRIVSKTQVFVS